MNQNELLRLCRQRGYSARTQKDEVLLQTCVFCGNSRWNLELNADLGVYNCWACPASGTVEQFLQDFLGEDRTVPVRMEEKTPAASTAQPDITHEAGLVPAWELPSSRDYLHGRGLTDQDIGRYTIYVSTNEEHVFYARLVFVLREYWTGQRFGYLARSYTNKEPKYLTEISQQEIALYEAAQIISHGVHVLVEGIFDAIRVAQAGFQAGAMLGKPSQHVLQEWAGLLDRKDTAVLMMDGDATKDAHRAAAIVRTIHEGETVVHELPEHLDPGALEPEIVKARVFQQLEENYVNDG